MPPLRLLGISSHARNWWLWWTLAGGVYEAEIMPFSGDGYATCSPEHDLPCCVKCTYTLSLLEKYLNCNMDIFTPTDCMQYNP